MEKLLNDLAAVLRLTYPQYMFSVLEANHRILIYYGDSVDSGIRYQVVVDSNPFETYEYAFVIKGRHGGELMRTRDFVMIKGKTFFNE